MLKFLSTSFGVSIQDLGRKGFRSIGVPTSGAMDMYSATLANLLLNNKANTSVLEIPYGRCEIQFTIDTIICISGADFSPTLNKNPIPLNKRIHVKANDVMSFGKRNYGIRTYLAVQNGFQTQTVLRSKSQYQGITKSNRVKKGMTLPVIFMDNIKEEGFARVKVNFNHFNSIKLECYRGPEFYLLSSIQKEKLTTTQFSISPNNSRMGYQLTETLENEFPSMLTSAVLPGTVQLTPSGKLIVLMRDCQVTGGYPRVLQLSETAINKLAQKATNDIIKFNLKELRT